MQRFLFAFAFAFVISLGSCAELQIAGQALSLAQKSAANPVTKDDLYKVESAMQIAIIALQTYKRSCLANAADAACRANIAAIQPYTREIPPYVAQLRSFVKNNDQINAGVVYNQLIALVTNLKATATARGINVGG